MLSKAKHLLLHSRSFGYALLRLRMTPHFWIDDFRFQIEISDYVVFDFFQSESFNLKSEMRKPLLPGVFVEV